jgi:hypothetical protein
MPARGTDGPSPINRLPALHTRLLPDTITRQAACEIGIRNVSPPLSGQLSQESHGERRLHIFRQQYRGPIPVRCVATHRLRPAQVGSTVSLRAAAMSARVAQRYPKDSAAIGRHLRHRMPKTVGLRRMRARFECLMSEEADKKLASIRPLYWNGTHPSVFECRVEEERDHDSDAAGASI